MMVTWVRGFFKDVHGTMEFDLDACLDTTFQGEMDATKLWTGEPDRDAHLKSNWIDLTLDVEAILEADLEKTGAIAYYRD